MNNITINMPKGAAAIIDTLQNNGFEAYLVVISNDASEGTKKRITDKCMSYETDYLFYGNCDENGKAIGTSNCVAIAITDEGFAKSLKEKYKNLTEVAENGSC